MNNDNKKKLSLTLRPAMIHESLIIAEEYNKFKDWTQVRDEVLSDNLLQARTASTLNSQLRFYQNTSIKADSNYSLKIILLF